MKRTIHTLCAVFALFAFVACSKSDDNDSKKDKGEDDIEVTNFNIPQEAKAILPDKTLTQMVANGMTIHEGTTPPNIEGIYLLDNLTFLYTSDPNDNAFTKGDKATNYKFKFYEQQGVKVKSDYKALGFGVFDTAIGSGAIISGSGNKFTVFLAHVAVTQGVKNKDVYVFSGEITSEGIKDLVFTMTVTEKEDQGNKIMGVGVYRIFSQDGRIAKKVTDY
ncbi:hypothetical protein RCZ04_06930 [Capnocytophaga sp. HP1101]